MQGPADKEVRRGRAARRGAVRGGRRTGRRGAQPRLHRLAAEPAAVGGAPGRGRLHACGCPGCPGTAPGGRTSTRPAGRTGTGGRARLRRAARPVRAGLRRAACRWAARWCCGWPSSAAAEVAGLVLVNPSLGTERKDLELPGPGAAPGGPVDARHRLATSASPARGELAYDRTPLRALHSLTAAVEGRRWPTCRGSPRRRCSTAAGSTTWWRPLSGRLLRDGASSCEVVERILEESLPRGHAGPRRAGDLRRQRGLDPAARGGGPGRPGRPAGD